MKVNFINKENISSIIASFCIVVLGFILYAQTLQAGFFFDDHDGILTNTAIRNIANVEAIWQRFMTRFIGYYSFAINYHFSQYNAFGYHLVNLAIHLITSLLVYSLVLQLFATPKLKDVYSKEVVQRIALFAGLIFVCHPLQTQAVSYIVQRLSSLAALFYIATIVLYLKARINNQKVLYILALITTVLAMLTKEITFTLPFMIIICECIFFGDQNSSRKRFLNLIPFLCTLGIIPLLLMQGFVKMGHVSSLTMETTDFTRSEYFLTQLLVLVRYLRLLIIPVGQCVDYDFPIMTTLSMPVVVSAIILLAVISSAFYFYKKSKLIAFGIIWFFLTISIESSIIPIHDVIQEHRLYLPMVGFSLFLSVLFYEFLRNRIVYLWTMIVVVTVFSMFTYNRNVLWGNETLMWENVLEQYPKKARVYHNLGEIYLKTNKIYLAKTYFKRSLDYDPNQEEPYINLGLIELEQGDLNQAEDFLKKAIAIKPTNAISFNNLGIIQRKLNKRDVSKDTFYKSLSIDQSLLEPRKNLAQMYKEDGDSLKAKDLYNQILEIAPFDEDALPAIVDIYFMNGQTENALTLGKKVLNRKSNAVLMTRLGSVFAKYNYTNMAFALFAQAQKIDPLYKEVYLELGKIYGNNEEFTRAIAVWLDGLRVDPNDKRFKDLILQARDLKEKLKNK